jgi:serine/threonine protein phosphatase PrpC
MRAVAAGLTDVGRHRTHNEDRFLLVPEVQLFVVADGMGGHQSGEVASRMAAGAIASFCRSDEGRALPVIERLTAAVNDANARICARSEDSRRHRGMGTTVVAAVFDGEARRIAVAHAGDSRCYRIRGGYIAQLTRDHSLISDVLAERPDLSESDLAYLPKNVITRALGIGPTLEVDVHQAEVEVGDVYLLCSDGLHGLVSDADIAAIIEDSKGLTEACTRLIGQANRQGGKDNITAVVVRIEGEARPWASRSPLPPKVASNVVVGSEAPPSSEPG